MCPCFEGCNCGCCPIVIVLLFILSAIILAMFRYVYATEEEFRDFKTISDSFIADCQKTIASQQEEIEMLKAKIDDLEEENDIVCAQRDDATVSRDRAIQDASDMAYRINAARIAIVGNGNNPNCHD